MNRIQADERPCAAERYIEPGPVKPYLAIEPMMDYRDYSTPIGHRAQPTTKFQVRWNSAGESFVREVNSVKELYSVLKPIIQANADSKKALDKQMAKNVRDEAEHLKKILKQRVDGARRVLKEAEKQLSDAS